MRAEALEQRRRGPIQRLADRAAVLDHEALLEVVVAQRPIGPEPCCLGGEGQQQPGEQEHDARVEGGGSSMQRTGDQRATEAGERDWKDEGDLTCGVLEPVGEPAADAATVPVDIEDGRR